MNKIKKCQKIAPPHEGLCFYCKFGALMLQHEDIWFTEINQVHYKDTCYSDNINKTALDTTLLLYH